MKYLFLLFFLFSACTHNSIENNMNDFNFSKDMTIEEFKIKLNDYADKSSYPSSEN
tara:strand:- start:232 stop:399 length:168 start_codon:yes stop_codon:yes gene_type:complete